MLDDEETGMLFQTYKMHLLHMDENAVSADGRELSLMKVIAESLKFIADKALQKLQEQIGKVVKARIRWVLTVPALWSEEHKHFMRKASLEAGIIEEQMSPNLLLCLEPEGASIQCREDSEDVVKQQLVKDKVVMVLDCGGGTVDITVHKLMCDYNEQFLCEELIPSSGGCEWGSKYVDVSFESFLEEFFGEELYERYTKNAMARLEILKHFEMLKRKFNPGVNDRSRLQLSYLSEEMSAKKLKELIATWNETKATEDDSLKLKQRGASSIDIPTAIMRTFFTGLFDKISDKVAELIEAAEEKHPTGVDFVFMVGGFSESPFLKSVIKDKFETESLVVLVPRRPQVSVI